MGRIKSRYSNEFSEIELKAGHDFMTQELKFLPKIHSIKGLFSDAWIDFMLGRFSYDGATFVKERNKNTIFEVAAFIHDWRNSKGYVGKEIDNEFLSIMVALNYKPKLIIQRWLLMRLTVINIARHYILGTITKKTPYNLYQL